MLPLSGVNPVTAAPRETGLHHLHAAKRVGSKVCFIEHEHQGDGLAFPSRHVAEASAARKWAAFTVDEYGSAWGSYAAAIAKRMSCGQDGAKYWVCKATARPCKVGR